MLFFVRKSMKENAQIPKTHLSHENSTKITQKTLTAKTKHKYFGTNIQEYSPDLNPIENAWNDIKKDY